MRGLAAMPNMAARMFRNTGNQIGTQLDRMSNPAMKVCSPMAANQPTKGILCRQ